MSANNQIIIRKVANKYQVLHVDVDLVKDYGIAKGIHQNLGSFKRLTDAVIAANKFMKYEYVEYGLNIIDI